MTEATSNLTCICGHGVGDHDGGQNECFWEECSCVKFSSSGLDDKKRACGYCPTCEKIVDRVLRRGKWIYPECGK